ncbi:hypothetical protein SAMN05216251_11570 [Actinacidiphila alni]|uniref:Lipoprotein n=1 Tax=Actinacidiphila alni TaxID=380248 RepID=A0A1I2IZ43_9ACTN|nr:hypothetical protein [Actinacidiphila alni]SFF46873.1 hypothetical protein SAMN05216251_11570 [Actinacidiphila alni]
MRNKTGKRYAAGVPALAALAVLLGALGTLSGCSVGAGAPDGWRYLRTDPLAVAVPKTWRATPTGAVLRGAGGRTDGEVTVSAAGETAAPGSPGAAPGPDKAAAAALATARKEWLVFDGHRGEVLSYVQAAPDGRRASRTEVRLTDVAGRPVTVRVWTVDGATDGLVQREIVNSIEFAEHPDR